MRDPSSRKRLTPAQAAHYPGTTLFDAVARTVCGAGVLPRKELHEAWEVARQARRRFRGGRVVDLCSGHGLLGMVMLLLDNTSPSAVCVDLRIPASAPKLLEALVAAWPRLAGRVELVEASLDSVELRPDDVVVSAHACGHLSDVVLDRAAAAGARVAVMPCCHHIDSQIPNALAGWMDGALAMDVTRATKLMAQGYDVHTRRIPEDITPLNRLLLAERHRPS